MSGVLRSRVGVGQWGVRSILVWLLAATSSCSLWVGESQYASTRRSADDEVFAIRDGSPSRNSLARFRGRELMFYLIAPYCSKDLVGRARQDSAMMDAVIAGANEYSRLQIDLYGELLATVRSGEPSAALRDSDVPVRIGVIFGDRQGVRVSSDGAVNFECTALDEHQEPLEGNDARAPFARSLPFDLVIVPEPNGRLPPVLTHALDSSLTKSLRRFRDIRDGYAVVRLSKNRERLPCESMPNCLRSSEQN